ncbi:protein CcmA, bactofilin family [Fodinibius roseus]|uniref:Protein CcmA, bactofilin family n=1 Tax=Fodinibius roseus TaxID=1194090 RepID=A0A1M4T5Y1_9BACT|nr:polymer-forming cytoskeletal protein [Fodinibius roseus]SHE39810.1 protein CcmA, bactofilin family [Fodinibius roseus]
MFNNNKDKKDKTNKKPMSSNNSDKNLPSVNMISEGTTLEGVLKTESDIRVAGTVDGEANAKGKVIVSSTGEIKGNIKAADADVAGKVDGEIKVTNKLILRESALVEGDIYTKTLLVEEGAQINGGFNMTEDKSNSGSKKKKTNGLSGSFNKKTDKKDTGKKKTKETDNK